MLPPPFLGSVLKQIIYSRPYTFMGLCTAVALICGRPVVVTLVHHSVDTDLQSHPRRCMV